MNNSRNININVDLNNIGSTNISSSNLLASNATMTNLKTTNLDAVTFSCGTLLFSNATMTNLKVDNISSTSLNITGITAGTLLASTSISTGALFSTGMTSKSLVINSTQGITLLGTLNLTSNLNFSTGSAGKGLNLTSNFTDGSTLTNSTISSCFIHRISDSSISAVNTGVTTNRAVTLFVAGSPFAGTNMTIAKGYAIQVGAGMSAFTGIESTSISSNTLICTNLTTTNLNVTGLTVGNINSTLSSTGSLSALTGTVPNILHTNVTTTSLNVTGITTASILTTNLISTNNSVGTSNSTLNSTGNIQALVGTIGTLYAGTISKGAGSFLIPWPSNPGKSLTHCFVEAPTRGENIYRYSVEVKGNHAVIELPEWFVDINENVQVWASPAGHKGIVYGECNDTLNFCNIYGDDGKYNILIIGTRCDDIAKKFFKGVVNDI